MARSDLTESHIDPKLILSYKFPEATFSYDERDVALYALGVGACGGDAMDEKELKYVHNIKGQPFIKVLPTFAALFPFKTSKGTGLDNVPGLKFDPKLLLHGQQYMEIYRPFPSSSYVENKIVIAGLHDKADAAKFKELEYTQLIPNYSCLCFHGKATVIELETTSYIKETGEVLCMNRSTIYLRGAGGFSNSSPRYSYANYPSNQVSHVSVPNSKPAVVHEDHTQLSQALLYRLSGDYNPLHSDPMIAQAAGFSRPILHGLCTLGYAVRAIIKTICSGDETAVRNIFGRFLLHVYPGETLVTEMWPEGTKVIFQTKVMERRRPVLFGYVVLKPISSSL